MTWLLNFSLFLRSIRFGQTRRCLQITRRLAFSVLADCIVHLAAVVPATQAQIVRIEEQKKFQLSGLLSEENTGLDA